MVNVLAAAFVLGTIWWVKTHLCAKCGCMISWYDRMGNGRIRYRMKDSGSPVCRSCGNNHPDEVE